MIIFSELRSKSGTLIKVTLVKHQEHTRRYMHDEFPKKRGCGLHLDNLQAVRLLENRRLKNAEEEKKWKQILVKLYLNLSLCYLRMRKPKPAITYSRNVLDFEPKNVKAIFRLGQVGGEVLYT